MKCDRRVRLAPGSWMYVECSRDAKYTVNGNPRCARHATSKYDKERRVLIEENPK